MATRRGKRKPHFAAPESPWEPSTQIAAAVAPQALRDRSRTVSRLATRLTREAERATKLAEKSPVEPTPEQLARQNYGPRLIKEPGAARQRIARFCRQSALDRYLARESISGRQYDAATRYREDHDQSGYDQSVVAQYGVSGGGGSGTAPGAPFTDRQLDARTRWRDARAALPQRLAPMFDTMVIDDTDAAAAGAQAGFSGQMAPRFALEYLRICANELADYYRLPGR